MNFLTIEFCVYAISGYFFKITFVLLSLLYICLQTGAICTTGVIEGHIVGSQMLVKTGPEQYMHTEFDKLIRIDASHVFEVRLGYWYNTIRERFLYKLNSI
jgi:hypothetical protein